MEPEPEEPEPIEPEPDEPEPLVLEPEPEPLVVEPFDPLVSEPLPIEPVPLEELPEPVAPEPEEEPPLPPDCAMAELAKSALAAMAITARGVRNAMVVLLIGEEDLPASFVTSGVGPSHRATTVPYKLAVLTRVLSRGASTRRRSDVQRSTIELGLRIAQGRAKPFLDNRMIERHIEHLADGKFHLESPSEQMPGVLGVRTEHLHTAETAACNGGIDISAPRFRRITRARPWVMSRSPSDFQTAGTAGTEPVAMIACSACSPCAGRAVWAALNWEGLHIRCLDRTISGEAGSAGPDDRDIRCKRFYYGAIHLRVQAAFLSMDSNSSEPPINFPFMKTCGTVAAEAIAPSALVRMVCGSGTST